MLLNLSDDLLLHGAQRLLLSELPDKFDIKKAFRINISEE